MAARNPSARLCSALLCSPVRLRNRWLTAPLDISIFRCFSSLLLTCLRACRVRCGAVGPDSGGGGFKRYFEEIAMVLKRHFPDVIIDREIVEVCMYAHIL